MCRNFRHNGTAILLRIRLIALPYLIHSWAGKSGILNKDPRVSVAESYGETVCISGRYEQLRLKSDVNLGKKTGAHKGRPYSIYRIN